MSFLGYHLVEVVLGLFVWPSEVEVVGVAAVEGSPEVIKER